MCRFTKDGDPETMLAKWLSLDNHVHNRHMHSDKKFPRYAHGKLTGNENRKNSSKGVSFSACMVFIGNDLKPSEKLSTLLTNNELCKAVCRLSPVHQIKHHLWKPFIVLSYILLRTLYHSPTMG